MDLGLKGKVAVVGGASKGLGRACAQTLAEEGAKVALCSRSQPDLEKAAKEIHDSTGAEVMTLAGDLDKHATIQRLIAATVERFGRLDILVNNSGGPPLAKAVTATEEQWATAVDRSLTVMRTIRPHMLTIERLSGALLIGMGILLFTEQLTRITSMLTRVFGNGLAL